MDILGPLLKNANGNQFVLVMTDLFSKFTGTITLQNMKAVTVVSTFLDDWVYLSVFFTPQGLPLRSTCISNHR